MTVHEPAPHAFQVDLAREILGDPAAIPIAKPIGGFFVRDEKRFPGMQFTLSYGVGEGRKSMHPAIEISHTLTKPSPREYATYYVTEHEISMPGIGRPELTDAEHVAQLAAIVAAKNALRKVAQTHAAYFADPANVPPKPPIVRGPPLRFPPR